MPPIMPPQAASQMPGQQPGQPPSVITDEQLLQAAQQVYPKLPLQQIMQMIQKFKAAGLSNEQIVAAAKYLEEQGQSGGQMMPNLKNALGQGE